jgi:sigma-54 dependent transcriptional regulator, acetoin dehydrogenase operon transcriptional activator AcoR
LGIVASMVQAIEKDLHLREKNQSLRKANEHLRVIIDSISDALITIDKEGIINTTNNNLRKLLNTSSTFHGKNIFEIFSDSSFLEKITAGETYNNREDTLTINASKIYCLNTTRPIKNEQNQFDGAVIILKERKEMHRMINKMIGAKATYTLDDIIYTSKKMEEIIKLAEAVSETDTRVLLEGESGTGKELFAQGIHNASNRREGPFIALNCGQYPGS